MINVAATIAALGALVMFSQAPSLDARFIGNMAFAVTDGSTTVMTDFPYESGYSVYMAYDPAEIRSSTPATLSLITHRHGDHWDRALFDKTNWKVAGPSDVTSSISGGRVVPLQPGGRFGPVQVEAIETPHASIRHHSYVVTWHDRRLYFSGDTESPTHLAAIKHLDAAFLSPWLYRAALKQGIRLDAKRIVIYHHRAAETVGECKAGCVVPKQGETIRIP